MKNSTYIIAILSISSLLFSCGGSSKSDKPEVEVIPPVENTETPETPDATDYILSGNIEGLSSGQISLQVNNLEEISIEQNGIFSFDTMFTANQQVIVKITNQPEAHQCQIINSESQFTEAEVDDVIVFCQKAKQQCEKTTAASQGDADLSGNNISGIELLVNDIECGTEQWRKDANARIEQHRKTSGKINLVDKNGEPVKNAKVNFTLQRHHFNFGGVVQAKMWHGEQGVTKQLYQDTYQSFGFNKAGFQNALKYKLRAGNQDLVPEIMTWLHDQDIPVRGHTLIWPGWSNMETSISVNDAARMGIASGAPSELSNADLKVYVDSIIKDWAAKWGVDEWDVANEVRGKQDVQAKLGYQEEAHWFKLAKQHVKNPNATLFLNENRVISDTETGTLTSKMQEFERDMLSILDNDGPLEALGFQSRFGTLSDGTLLDAETMYQRLQYFDKYQLPIAATEFEMKASGENLGIATELDRALMTERVMSVYFSKENVTDILVWTFFKKGDDSQRHIVEIDGTPNLRGKAWLYMIKKHWHTNETTYFNRDSNTHFSGFKGKYIATVSIDNFSDETVEFDWIEGSSGVTLKLSNYVN